MVGEAMPMQARSRYYPRLTDAKLSLRLTARELLSTEARLSALHWHRHLPPSLATCPFIMSEQSPQTSKRKKRGYLAVTSLALTGNFLSSQLVSKQVLSAFMCLTTVFGMGTGGTT